VGAWYQVVSYDVKTRKVSKVFYKDPAVPNVMISVRAIGPVFSPTRDVLVYADTRKLYVCNSKTGAKIAEQKVSAPLENTGLAFTPDGKRVAYFSKHESMVKVFYTVETVDIASGERKEHALPVTVRPHSTAYARSSVNPLCLDFSPDGRYVVFSATPKPKDETFATSTFNELSCKGKSDVYVLDTKTGACHRLTSDGKSFDPVWKGR
jgi:Tol biopolymer transport system component